MSSRSAARAAPLLFLIDRGRPGTRLHPDSCAFQPQDLLMSAALVIVQVERKTRLPYAAQRSPDSLQYQCTCIWTSRLRCSEEKQQVCITRYLWNDDETLMQLAAIRPLCEAERLAHACQTAALKSWPCTTGWLDSWRYRIMDYDHQAAMIATKFRCCSV